MTEARPRNSNPKVAGNQEDSSQKNGAGHILVGGRWLPHWNAKAPSTSKLLNLRQAMEMFDVEHTVIYALANAGLIDALQKDGKGRVYYSEPQLRRALSGQYRLSRSAA